jgi:hypothetical protein
VQIDVKKMNLTADDKYGIVQIWHNDFDEKDVSSSAAHFAKRHVLNKKTFHNWKMAYFKLIHDKQGRPNPLDQISMENIQLFTKTKELCRSTSSEPKAFSC